MISAWSGDGVFGICGMAGTFRALALLPERVCMKVWTGCLATSQTRYVALLHTSSECRLLSCDLLDWRAMCLLDANGFATVGVAGVKGLPTAGFPLPRAFMNPTLCRQHFILVLNFAGRF